MKKPIYLDNAATTAARPEVIEAMLPYFGELYGNPSTVYSLGASSKQAEENARGIIAGTLGTDPKNIYFTAGGIQQAVDIFDRGSADIRRIVGTDCAGGGGNEWAFKMDAGNIFGQAVFFHGIHDDRSVERIFFQRTGNDRRQENFRAGIE